jgi:Mg-chelatase subunit ChlD
VLFAIIPFSGGARPMEDGLIEMDDAERENAIAFVDKQIAAGSTNVYDALAAAFDDDRIDTIYLLTDGDPSVGEITDVGTLREEVARWNSVRGIRIHCIAVGKDSGLLKGLAEDSGGKYVRVD